MLRISPTILLSLASLCLVTQTHAQNACPEIASFNNQSIDVEATVTTAEVGDVNGDGHLDALWLDPTEDLIYVDLGNGQGGVLSSPKLVIPNDGSAAVGDLTEDGIPDIIVHDNGSTKIYVGNGQGGFLANEVEPPPLS